MAIISVDKEANTVTITIDRYNSLVEDAAVLSALSFGGVDNWEWYDASIEDHYAEPEYL